MRPLDLCRNLVRVSGQTKNKHLTQASLHLTQPGCCHPACWQEPPLPVVVHVGHFSSQPLVNLIMLKKMSLKCSSLWCSFDASLSNM